MQGTQRVSLEIVNAVVQGRVVQACHVKVFEELLPQLLSLRGYDKSHI